MYIKYIQINTLSALAGEAKTLHSERAWVGAAAAAAAAALRYLFVYSPNRIERSSLRYGGCVLQANFC